MDDKFAPLDKMSKDELIKEVEKWRVQYTWMHEDLRSMLGNIGKVVRVITRSNTQRLGIMLQPQFELKSIEVGVNEKSYDPNVGEYFIERKTVIIPASGIAGFEVIAERAIFEEMGEADLSALSLTCVESEEN